MEIKKTIDEQQIRNSNVYCHNCDCNQKPTPVRFNSLSNTLPLFFIGSNEENLVQRINLISRACLVKSYPLTRNLSLDCLTSLWTSNTLI